MKTILALLAAMIFVWATKLDLTALTAVIALAAIGCCGLLYDISILLSRIHDDMPGPVRDQRLAHEALVAKVKAEMEADGKRVIAERKRNEVEKRKPQRALAYQWRFAYTHRRLVTWFHVGIDAVLFPLILTHLS